MALRQIVKLPDKVLKTVSEPVTTIDDELLALIDDMLATMYDAPGIGLAAIQVGVAKRLLVMDVAEKDAPRDPRVIINPEITWQSEDTAEYEEGCLSIPEVYEMIERPASVKVRYQDRDGATREELFEDLAATCVQHEIDHLNGILFIDHISRLKRDRVIKKFVKQARQSREPA